MIARSMTFTAKAGHADELAGLLVQVAEGLRDTSGCVSWIVARNPEADDEVWVQELWETADAADAAIASADSGDGPSPADVIALCAGTPQRVDLDAIGGVGYTA